MKYLSPQKHRLSISLILVFFSTASQAGIQHDHHKDEAKPHSRHHDAHAHGVAQLNIAIDNNTLMIELTSPAANIIGFEHKIESDAEEKAYDLAIQQLTQPASLFIANSEALCAITDIDINSSFDSNKPHKQHNDFSAEYTFICHNMNGLDQIHTKLLQVFPNTEEVNVQIIDDSGQRTAQINQYNHTINFK